MVAIKTKKTKKTHVATKIDRVGDMTIGELKALMRGLLQELQWEREQDMPDPDEGKKLKPEVEAQIRAAIQADQWDGEPLDQVVRDLGLE